MLAPLYKTKLKVCGITTREDYELCASQDVDAVGFNFWPSSKRATTPAKVAKLLEGANTSVLRVGVFVDPEIELVREAFEAGRLDLIQLHGDRPVQAYASLGLPYIWVLRGTPNIRKLEWPEPGPTVVLLDAKVRGYGGQGHKTDWDWARSAVRAVPVPAWLAGGVKPQNVADALDQVRPQGVDVATGSEPENPAYGGQKDPEAVAELAAICHARSHASVLSYSRRRNYRQ